MRITGKQFIPLVIACMVVYLPVSAGESDSYFDASEFKLEPFEFKGYAQLQSEMASINNSGTPYQLLYDADDSINRLGQTTASVELEASYNKNAATYLLRTYSSRSQNTIDQLEIEHDIYEAYMSLQLDAGLNIDLGKKLNRWGKGYAWNPVGFVERKKDPSDPELSREGYWVASMDFVKSMDGDLKTIAFTPIVLPNDGEINDEFGEPDHSNLGGKIYLLYRDTDIDFTFLTKGSKTARYGVDFARNIAPHFEVHGEYAYITDTVRIPLTDNCNAGEKVVDDVSSYLMGLRYRTENDIHHIAEYYYNGEGFTEDELKRFYSCVHQAWDALDNDLLDDLATINSLNAGAYTTQNPMQRYMHLKSWWSEPYDILYFTPGIQLFYNVDDGSYSVMPEVVYTGVNNLQLRARVKYFSGDLLTEYGEKLSENKVEFRLRYYF